MVAAIKAYAIKFKKEIKIKKTAEGIEIAATNFSIKDLKELDSLDLIKFDPVPQETDSAELPETPPYTESKMGFNAEKPPNNPER